MDVEYRPVGADDLGALLLADQRAFGSPPRKPDDPDSWARLELERARVALDGGEVVGVGRSYSFELTVPGGATLPAAAVSWIGVVPTHRRRGILSGLMRELHDDARARGEPLSMLTASESSIYGRFGYGVATWQLGFTIERPYTAFARPLPPGRLRLVDDDEGRDVLPRVYEAVRAQRAGSVSRPTDWWEEAFWSNEPDAAWFTVVSRDADGSDDGYASYKIEGDFFASGGLSGSRMTVVDLQARSEMTRAVLWRYLFDVDLVTTVRAVSVPVDDPVRWWLAEPRRLRVDYVNDRLWVAVHDPVAVLGGRRYDQPGTLVVEVHGSDGVARVALDAGHDGVQADRTDRSADLGIGVRELGSVLLGGVRWRELAAAGLVDEHAPGALARADAMFATSPAPATLSWF